jgi:hypothetical protein
MLRQSNGVGAILYVIAFSVIKLSILLLYLRIFGITHKRTRLAVWILIGLVTCIGISGLFGFLFLCDPVKKLFLYQSPGQCNFNAIGKLSRAQAFMHVFTDILITIVPIPMVWRLKLPTVQRLGVLAIMATGTIVTIVSIIRLSYLFPKRPPLKGPNVSGQYHLTFWSLLELNIALICTSAPALKQFVGGTFPAVRSYASHLSSKVSGASSHSFQTRNRQQGSFASSKPSWTTKFSKWGSTSEQSHSDGIMQETSISMDRRVKDGSYLELGPMKEEIANPSRVYGPVTHVTAGDREMHATSRREPIMPQ